VTVKRKRESFLNFRAGWSSNSGNKKSERKTSEQLCELGANSSADVKQKCSDYRPAAKVLIGSYIPPGLRRPAPGLQL